MVWKQYKSTITFELLISNKKLLKIDYSKKDKSVVVEIVSRTNCPELFF